MGAKSEVTAAGGGWFPLASVWLLPLLGLLGCVAGIRFVLLPDVPVMQQLVTGQLLLFVVVAILVWIEGSGLEYCFSARPADDAFLEVD